MSRNVIAVVASGLFVAFAALIVFVPVPYVTWRPGSTLDLLTSGSQGSYIEVAGHPEPVSEGSLLMTTVATSAIDTTVSLPEAIIAYVAQDSDSMPRDVIYPAGKSKKQVRQEGVAAMDNSREIATVAALKAAGEAVTELPMVAAISLTGPARELLQVGDLITSVDDQSVTSGDEVASIVRQREVGDSVVLRVIRDGEEQTITIVTQADSEGRPIIGVNEVGIGYVYSPSVVYRIDPDFTGPSAGLVFSLAVYQQVTGTDLLGEAVVAGTGTIDATGKVGPIGGIREKIKGAERDGATVFLMPEANCEALGDLETSVRIIPVPSLREAISALQILRSDSTSEGVPSCE